MRLAAGAAAGDGEAGAIIHGGGAAGERCAARALALEGAPLQAGARAGYPGCHHLRSPKTPKKP
eukprot:1554499-Pyramimonas_sp.AAC.1